MKKVKPDNRKFLLEKMPQNSICAEIGVWKGVFTQKILNLVQPQELHLIDPWLFQKEFPNRLYSGMIAQNQEDMDNIYESVVAKTKDKNVIIHRNFSSNVLPKFADNYLDWIYIDGNHNYEFVKQDLELSVKKVKVGGFITGDDYNWHPQDNCPVRKAVNEFIATGLVTVEEVRNNQFILRKE